jgi:hypothetical protein
MIVLKRTEDLIKWYRPLGCQGIGLREDSKGSALLRDDPLLHCNRREESRHVHMQQSCRFGGRKANIVPCGLYFFQQSMQQGYWVGGTEIRGRN